MVGVENHSYDSEFKPMTDSYFYSQSFLLTAGSVFYISVTHYYSADASESTLLIFMVIDFINGFIKAWALKEFDSSKFYIDGVKKLGILLIVAVATQLDQLIHIDSMALRTVTV